MDDYLDDLDPEEEEEEVLGWMLLDFLLCDECDEFFCADCPYTGDL